MPKVRKMVVAGNIRWSAAFCNCSSSSLNFEHCWRICRLFFRFLLEEDKKMKQGRRRLGGGGGNVRACVPEERRRDEWLQAVVERSRNVVVGGAVTATACRHPSRLTRTAEPAGHFISLHAQQKSRPSLSLSLLFFLRLLSFFPLSLSMSASFISSSLYFFPSLNCLIIEKRRKKNANKLLVVSRCD